MSTLFPNFRRLAEELADKLNILTGGGEIIPELSAEQLYDRLFAPLIAKYGEYENITQEIIESKFNDLKTAIEANEDALGLNKIAIEAVKSAVDLNKAAVNLVKGVADNIKAKTDNLDASMSSLKTQVDITSSAVVSTKQAVDLVKGVADNIKTKTDNLDASMSSLKTQVDLVTTGVATNKTAVDAVATAVGLVDAAVDLVKGVADNIKTKTDNLDASMSSLKTEVEAVKAATEPYKGSSTTGANVAIPDDTVTQILSISGKGFCDWIEFRPTESSFTCYVYCDDVLAFGQQIGALNTDGYDKTTEKIQMIKYAVDAFCIMQLTHRFDFQSSLKLKAWHNKGAGVTCTGRVRVTKI